MKERWVYWMLLNESGNVIAFCRETGGRALYADMRADRWSRQPIAYADRVRLVNPPEGLRTLKGCGR